MDGSSIRIIFGLPIRARPTASICCSPPDSVPASWRRRSLRRGNRSYTSSMVFALSVGSVKAPISRFSSTVIWGKICRPSGTCASFRVMILLGSVLRKSCPSKVTEPLAAFSSPVIVRSVVVFPAPLAPISETISPSFTVMETPFSA